MFGVFKTYSDVKKGIKNPTAFGQDMALDVLKGPLVVFTFLTGVFFAALFIVGFTGLLGGPYVFFKVVFWLFLIPAGIIGLIVWTLFGRIKRALDIAGRKMTQKGDIITAEVVKGDKNLT